jgi:hypothetical protein
VTFEHIIESLQLPQDALVDQRVPKKLLMEQGAPTATDRRQFQDGIEEVYWIAALKPTNIGVPAFRNTEREYLEIAILTAVLRPKAKSARLIELLHRAIPYPLILLTRQQHMLAVSLSHKRWSQAEAGKVVLEDLRQVSFDDAHRIPADSPDREFLDGIAISKLDASDLFAMYESLFARLLILEASRILADAGGDRTGRPGVASLQSNAELRHQIDRHAQLTRELAFLRAKAHKEKQISRRAELNLEVQRLNRELATLQQGLTKDEQK